MQATPRETRDILIESHLEHARNLASRLALRLPRHVGVQELECDAYLGLLNAAESFDPARGVLFRTHATRRINGAMLDGLREREQIRRYDARVSLVSLDDPIDDGEGGSTTWAECLADGRPPVGQTMELLDEAGFAMRGWAPRLRRVMVEYHLHGLSQHQVSEKLGVSEGAVERHLKQARGQAAARSRRAERG